MESNHLVGYLVATIIYLRPVNPGEHSPSASLSCKNPDYLHRPSGANDIILIGCGGGRYDPATVGRYECGTLIPCGHSLRERTFLTVRLQVAEITRSAIGKLIKDDATTLTGTQGNRINIVSITLTGYYVVSSFVSHIPAMSQNLGGIAPPFAVLGVASLLSVDFAGGNQVFQLLYAAYDFRGRIFAECLSLHDTKDILQHDFGGID